MLAYAIGYEGNAHYVSFYWEPGGDEAMYDDGRRGGTGHWDAYLTFIQHRRVRVGLGRYFFTLGSSDDEATHCLVLDSVEQTFRVMTRAEARTFLDAQHPPRERVELSADDMRNLEDLLKQSLQEIHIDHAQIAAQMERHREIVQSLATWLERNA
jgi:hypothetical protein